MIRKYLTRTTADLIKKGSLSPEKKWFLADFLLYLDVRRIKWWSLPKCSCNSFVPNFFREKCVPNQCQKNEIKTNTNSKPVAITKNIACSKPVPPLVSFLTAYHLENQSLKIEQKLVTVRKIWFCDNIL